MASLNDSSSSLNVSCGGMDTVARPVFITICSLLFVASVLLNGFTLRVYFCRAPPRRSSVTVYLQNLAAADFLLGLCLPLRVAHYSSPSSAMQWAYCHVGAPAFYLNMYASILFMGYIAANRYLKVVRSLESHALLRAARAISALTWASLLTPMGVYVGLSLAQPPPDPAPTGAGGGSWECAPPHTPPLRLLHRAVHGCSAVVFFLALAALVAFYGGTAWRLALAQRRSSAVAGGGAAGRRCAKLARARRNMLVLVAVFCVCFVPYHLVRLLYVFLWPSRPGYPPAAGQRLLKEATVMLSALNVCLDPLVYFFFCRAFRRQLALGGALLGRRPPTPTAEDSRTSLTLPPLGQRASISVAPRRTSVV